MPGFTVKVESNQTQVKVAANPTPVAKTFYTNPQIFKILGASDMAIVNPADGQVLTWNATSQLFTLVTPQADQSLTTARAAFDKANSANILAQAAFNKANTGTSIGNVNNSITFVTGSGLTVNTGQSITIVSNGTLVIGVNSSSTLQPGIVQLNDTTTSTSTTLAATANAVNTSWSYAQSSFTQANNATNLAISAFNEANSFQSVINSTFSVANSGQNLALSAFANANAALALANSHQSVINSAFATANVAFSAYTQANATNNIAQGAYNEANSFQSIINTSYSTANVSFSAYANANAALAMGNSFQSIINSAFSRANTLDGIGSLTIQTANGVTVNSGTILSLTANGTLVVSSNLATTTQLGVVQLNDTLTSNSTTLAPTANILNYLATQGIPLLTNTQVALVNTIKDLRNINTSSFTGNNYYSIVAGYNTPGDGGGGIFYWNTIGINDTCNTTNGGVVVANLSPYVTRFFGMGVSGSGIANNTTIASIVNPTTITLSLAATANNINGSPIVFTLADDSVKVFKPNILTTQQPGRWVRRTEDNTITLEMAGGAGDYRFALNGVGEILGTDNSTALNRIFAADGARAFSTSDSCKGAVIVLGSGKNYRLAGSNFVPFGMSIIGSKSSQGTTINSSLDRGSIIALEPTALLNMSTGSRLEGVKIFRRGLDLNPTTNTVTSLITTLQNEFTANLAWQANTAYSTGNVVINLGNVYQCDNGGISNVFANTGGPIAITQTANSIVDGTVTWHFLNQYSWTLSMTVPTGAIVCHLNNIYFYDTGGITNASVGPTSTSNTANSITDGTAKCHYIGSFSTGLVSTSPFATVKDCTIIGFARGAQFTKGVYDVSNLFIDSFHCFEMMGQGDLGVLDRVHCGPFYIPTADTPPNSTWRYKNGVCFFFHDRCDGCVVENSEAENWAVGFRFSNVWGMNITKCLVETPGVSLNEAAMQLRNIISFCEFNKNYVDGFIDYDIQATDVNGCYVTNNGGQTQSQILIRGGQIGGDSSFSGPGGSTNTQPFVISGNSVGTITNLHINRQSSIPFTVKPYLGGAFGWDINDINILGTLDTNNNYFTNFFNIDPTSAPYIHYSNIKLLSPNKMLVPPGFNNYSDIIVNPIPGGTSTVSNGSNWIYISSNTNSINAYTIKTPYVIYDQKELIISSNVTINNITILTQSGQAIDSVPTTLIAHNAIKYKYLYSTNTWVSILQNVLNDTLTSNLANQAATANMANTLFTDLTAVNNFATGAYNTANASFSEANSFQSIINTIGSIANTAAGGGITRINFVANAGSLMTVNSGLSATITGTNQTLYLAANVQSGGGSGGIGSLTINATNGVAVNSGSTLTITSNNTILLTGNSSSTSQVGVVQLNDTTLSTSTTLAATANAVNTAWSYAQSAFIHANSQDSIIGTIGGIANSGQNLALSAFGEANSFQAVINSTYATANVSFSAFAEANSFQNVINSSYATANVSFSAFGVANSGQNLAISAFNEANSFQNVINSSYSTANVSFSAFGVANSAQNLALSAFSEANSFQSIINSAFSEANSFQSIINSAFIRANAAVQNQFTFISSNGITVNTGTSLIVVGNNTVLLSANLGNTTQAGIVQLNDTLTSTSTTQAATANMANTLFIDLTAVNNFAAGAYAKANSGGTGGSLTVTYQATSGIAANGGSSLVISGNGTILLTGNAASTTQVGVVQLNDTETSTSTTQAATANAVNTTWAYAQSAFVTANNALPLIGGQLTGPLSINTANTIAFDMVNALSFRNNTGIKIYLYYPAYGIGINSGEITHWQQLGTTFALRNSAINGPTFFYVSDAIIPGSGAITIGGMNYSGNGPTQIGFGANNRGVVRFVSANGKFANAGDAQWGITLLRNQSIGAANTINLSTSGSNTTTNSFGVMNQLQLGNNSVYAFKGTVVARDTTNMFVKIWTVEGGIKNVVGPPNTIPFSNTSYVGTPIINIIAADNGTNNWTINLSVDQQNNAMLVQTSGSTNTTNWVAKIETTEVA